ncbi:MAG: type II secretion system protein [Chthonomonadales bacterium]
MRNGIADINTPAARRRSAAFHLVELLVVIAILAIVAAFILPKYLGGHTAGGKAIKAPVTAARDVECRSNLAQLRQAIEMERQSSENGSPPPNLQALRSIPRQMLVCPVGGEAYVYDPQTGAVHCPHPGHENF